MTSVRRALGAGLALMVVAIGVTLTRSPPAVIWSNFTPLNHLFAESKGKVRACQQYLTLPRGASAVRFSVYSVYGPRLTVKILAGDRTLTSGVRDAGWIGQSPTVPLRPVPQSVSHVKLCFAFGRMLGPVRLEGGRSTSTETVIDAKGQRLPGRMRVEYLEPGHRSWFSLASSVARRMGLGHWAAGTWVVLLVMALIAAIVVSASWLTIKELR